MMKSIEPFTKIISITFLFLIVFTFGCQQKPKDILTEKEAKILLDLYMETMNKADLDLVDEIISTDFVLRTPFLPQPLVGIENYKKLVINTSQTFSNFKATIDEVIVKGDKIWGRFSMEGVNTGPMGNIPATGKKFHITGLAITRIAKGKIAEDNTFWNVLGLYQQLGFTLTPPKIQNKQ